MIINPAYQNLIQMLPKLQGNLDTILSNKTRWGELADQYEERMKVEKLKFEGGQAANLPNGKEQTTK